MKNFNIILAGPVESGKTTAIKTLCASPLKTSNTNIVDVSDKTEEKYESGVMSLGANEKIYLHAVTEQHALSSIAETLATDGFGVILLLDNTRDDSLNDMTLFLESLKEIDDQTSVSIGITRTDTTPLLSMELYQKKLKQLNFNSAIFEVDTRDFSDMSYLVQALLFTIDPGLEYSA